METTIYIDYTENGDAANAFAVRLASEDGTYGLKRVDTGTVILPSGTPVDNPTTGLYQKVLTDLDPDAIYVASWEVFPFEGSDPRYRTEQIGPFFLDDGVRVRATTKGTFTQGTFATLTIRLYDNGGSPVDAKDIRVTINQADTQTGVVVSVPPTKLGKGIYIYDWAIAGDQTPGEYDVIWFYNVNGVDRVEPQEVEVAPAAPESSTYSGILPVLRLRLEQMLSGLQAISLHFLQANPTGDLKTYGFPFQNWNQSAGVKVYRNQKLITKGFQIDYGNGLILFDRPQLKEDQIHVSCVFRFFDDDDLDLFLLNGLNAFNIFPPHTGHMSFHNIPQHYVPPIFYGAAVDAIRTFMQALIWPKNRALFESTDQADKAFERYNTVKENYEKQWETLCNQKKLFPYTGLHRLIIQPMYTLPGGRARFFRYLFGGGS